MSYILDALRKSDQQRQHGMVPTLSSAPYPAPQVASTGKPAWPLMALLAILLLVAAAAIGWLRPWQTTRPQPQAPQLAAVPDPVTTAPQPIESTVALPAPPIQAPTPEHLPAETRVIPTAAPAPQAVQQVQAAPLKDDAGPPPKISMTVHAYSSDPADRLAGINGKMVREGEMVEPGLKLERITPDGVILNYRGRRLRHDMR